MHAYLNTALAAAKEAALIINKGADNRRFIKKKEKAPNDFVTEIDLQAEACIMEAISACYPDHRFLTEESHPDTELEGDAPLWIIDPLDGTSNFLRGIDQYVISIAVYDKGQVQHGLIYNPTSGDYYAATRGRGARFNAKRIRVEQQNNRLSTAMVSTSLPRNRDYLDKQLAIFRQLAQKSKIRSSGSFALDLAYVASAKLDAFWCYDAKIWDYAAGLLIVKEAGGRLTSLEGAPLTFPCEHILASSPALLPACLTLLNETHKVKKEA